MRHFELFVYTDKVRKNLWNYIWTFGHMMVVITEAIWSRWLISLIAIIPSSFSWLILQLYFLQDLMDDQPEFCEIAMATLWRIIMLWWTITTDDALCIIAWRGKMVDSLIHHVMGDINCHSCWSLAKVNASTIGDLEGCGRTINIWTMIEKVDLF